MPLKLENPEVKRLAAEIAGLTGESRIEAIRKALEERRRRLKEPSISERRERLLRHLRTKVWSKLPKKQLGRRLPRAEEDALLGYGPEGV